MSSHFAHIYPLCAINVRRETEIIAILASGSGTSTKALVHYLINIDNISVAFVATDNPHTGVLQRAERLGVRSLVLQRKRIANVASAEQLREQYQVTTIVPTGFLGLVPEGLLRAFLWRILSIRPGLLSDYGGEGIYGDRVHECVFEEHCKVGGITIHLIDGEYDHDSTLCEMRLVVHLGDMVDTLAERIHRLGHIYCPIIVTNHLTRLGPTLLA